MTCFELWDGLKQGFRLTRTITRKGKTTTEVVHGITSLSEDRADAGRLLELVRQHWSIENQLHYVRDVTLGEDACRVRSGNAPQVLAGLRNVVVCLLSQQLGESQPEVIQRLAARLEEALDILKNPKPNSV